MLRGLNLSAQEDATELKEYLAGKTALSSAHTYPLVLIGDGRNKGREELKQINDKINAIPHSLNPDYFRAFELDSILPEDWQLQISIYNSNAFWKRDVIIGSASIDLEDRLIGNEYKKQMMTYDILIKKWEEKRKKAEAADLEDEVKKWQEMISKAATLQESASKEQSPPVEYLALKNPSKNTPQGSLEMFVEVLPADIGKTILNSSHKILISIV